MSTDAPPLPPRPPRPPHSPHSPRPVTPGLLEWLDHELTEWRAEGLLADDQATAIRSRYRPSRRFSIGRLLLTLGGAFVGVGLFWLVAANLHNFSPLVRFLIVAIFWLAALVSGEVLAFRRPEHPAIPAPLVGAVRLMAALAFGAVVYQAAQSLDASLKEPYLLGLWSLGAFAYAYLVRATMPLLVGIGTGTGWLIFQTAHEVQGTGQGASGLTVVLWLAGAGVLGVALSALHERWRREFAAPWRETGTALLLAGLFAAAIPMVDADHFEWRLWLVGFLAVVGVAAAAALVLAPGRGRLEPLGALAVLAVAVGLVLWDAGNDPDADLTAAAVLHAVVAIVVYVLVAVAVAVVGTLRDSWRLTALATAALVVFTTFQSFAVFARLITGAWLFLLLGVIFLATGVLFDRARRGIAATLEEGETPVRK